MEPVIQFLNIIAISALIGSVTTVLARLGNLVRHLWKFQNERGYNPPEELVMNMVKALRLGGLGVTALVSGIWVYTVL